MRNSNGGIVGMSIGMVVLFTSMAAWGTHVITCIADGRWGFLIAGALAAPVAVVHGVGIWFGAW